MIPNPTVETHGRDAPPGRLYAVAVLFLAMTVTACTGAGEGARVRVDVPRGTSFSAVADSLAAHGVIDHPTLFRLYARVRGAADDIQAGVYGFRRGAGWNTILEDLRTGDVLTHRITIPEGWQLTQIAPRLAEFTNLSADSILEVLRDSATVQRYDVPGPTMEGYLYPATYTVPVGAGLHTIIERMISEYKELWTPERLARADSLGMTKREVTTLASIIQSEVKVLEEMPLVSAVFHNRLDIGYPLGASPTVQYALDRHHAHLSYAEVESVAESPYNTYTHPGLPPGPIGSPSARAIRAALYPADVDYLYFVARPNGTHIFTRSLRAHNRAKQRVKRMRRRLENRRAAAGEE